MFQIISGTSKMVSGTQNLERNVPTTAHKNVPTNSRLLGTLFQLAFPVVHVRCHRRILTFCKKKKQKQLFRFEETPLIHGRKNRNQVGVSDRRLVTSVPLCGTTQNV